MQRNTEKRANHEEARNSELLNRLDSVAQKSREVYNGAIEDFRNSFTLGSTKFETDLEEQ